MDLARDTPPIMQPHHRVPPAKREEMQCTIQEMAEAGIIERSNSSWCSPVLSPKKCTPFHMEDDIPGSHGGQTRSADGPIESVSSGELASAKDCCRAEKLLGTVHILQEICARLCHHSRTIASADKERSEFSLKQALVEAPVLPYPDPSLPYILDTDASQEGVSAVLSPLKDGLEYVVAYYSCKFSKPERNYCGTRKELAAVVKGLSHFHHYLYGAQFTIRTDHAALRWLKTLKEPKGQLARWLGKLEQYNYQVVHRAGRVHSNADSLSRRPCEPDCNHCFRCESEITCRRLVVSESIAEADKRWREDQQKDQDLAPVIQWLEAGKKRPQWEAVSPESPATKFLVDQWEALRLENGVLQRSWVDAVTGKQQWLIVAPLSRREGLLKEVHSGKTSGHLGIKRTMEKLRRRVYWVGLQQDVQEWCRTCQAGAPMERMAVDIAGPFPCTERGNKYICVAMDYFSKWPEAGALPNHEAESRRIPGELHSDQGREFESRVFRECCRLLGIHKTRTTPLRPQSEGMVEWFNATLVTQIAKYCEEDQHDWDEWVPYMLMAYLIE
ncbi:hypothetical protein C7M84_019127 [Penaeus vannamei]|uniref:RNA-directed DNA polymerase n=1 Tax=Penaeus vannamei TaxID=6689 RepID=A0A3R7PXZ3_PENVA|nr:hypothetical protein C7M84_019127 [Penaeus vannamei]